MTCTVGGPQSPPINSFKKTFTNFARSFLTFALVKDGLDTQPILVCAADFF